MTKKKPVAKRKVKVEVSALKELNLGGKRLISDEQIKKIKSGKKDATVEQMKFTWTPYTFETSDDQRLREKCLDISLDCRASDSSVGETRETVEQILDRAEQFYQFVKKK